MLRFCLRFAHLALIAPLLAACAAAEPFDDTPPALDCDPAPPAQVLDGDWAFRLDPDDIGIDESWHQADLSDEWDALAPGTAWENSGNEAYADYDGVAWYRTAITLPEWKRVYLTASRIDDRGTVYINGEEAAQWQFGGSRVGTLPLHDWGTAGDRLTLAIRVDDDGVYGGIMDALRIADTPRAGLTPDQWVATLSDAHPDWLMPTWTQDAKLAWTLTGGIGKADESLVSIDGLIAPLPDLPTVEAWLYDPETNTLEGGAGRIAFNLVEGSLPIPRWEWHGEDAFVQNMMLHDHEDNSLRWQLTVENTLQKRLIIAARPLAANRTANPIYAASAIDSSRLWLNGAPYLIAATKPESAGVGSLEAVMAAALNGEVPAENQVTCLPEGDGAAMLLYTLNPGTTTLHFAFSLDESTFPAVDIELDERLTSEITRWQEATTRTRFIIPDDRIAASIPASIGYLLLANDPDGPHPGSLAHDAVWVRDAAYTGKALLQTGHADTVRGYLDAVFAGQDENGRVPPIQGESIPWDDDEWDSQGQAMYLTVQYYRHTGEREVLEQWYPNVKLAGEFLVELLAVNAESNDPTIRGLLPPSLSAEDLGPADHHYYWDNFWAIAGLEEAAYAAELLGHDDDAEWMLQTAADLREAVLLSIEAVMGEDPAFIPAAVEDTTTSAMARGSVPSLWPHRVLDPESPLVQRSFEHYFAEWLEPYGGAYRHREAQFWPYGGMGIAHAHLRLGQTGSLHTILGWSLSNQTLPDTFAWAEQISPSNGGFTGGDMPHAWAAGSWTTLIREMMISEWDDRLHLFEGVPSWWFEGERVVGLTNAPTYFGALNLQTSGTLTGGDDGWNGSLTISLEGSTPPGGFHWRLPHTPDSIEGDATLDGDTLIIAPEGGDITLTFGD